MRAQLRIPTAASLANYHQQLVHRPFNYPEQRASRGTFPPGYDHDRNRILLGTGPAVFAKAKQHLQSWQHFPTSWTKIYPTTADIQPGLEVVVLFRLFGLWWRNGARVVYVLDENSPLSPHSSLLKTYAFAYGTLQGHIERGEEIFYVSMEADEQVYYGIEAFSTPAWWPVQFVYPLARHFQRRFVLDSMEQMRGLLRGEERGVSKQDWAAN